MIMQSIETLGESGGPHHHRRVFNLGALHLKLRLELHFGPLRLGRMLVQKSPSPCGVGSRSGRWHCNFGVPENAGITAYTGDIGVADRLELRPACGSVAIGALAGGR